MFRKYYFHAIEPQLDVLNSEKILKKLDLILKSQHLYSRKLSNTINLEKNGFNGNDYISLCDYSKKDAPPFNNDPTYLGYTAYNAYILLSLSLLINKNSLKVITPTIIEPTFFSLEAVEKMKLLGLHSTQRFSDMPDEVQVKDKISLTHMEGITIPTQAFVNLSSVYETKKLLTQIQDLLATYHYEKPIYDLISATALSKPADIEKVLKKRK